MGTAGGFALVVPVVPTVGKQVFLRLVTAITTVMPRMTPAVTMVKKAAVGGKKSPAVAGTKTAALEKPLPTLLMPIPTLLKPLPGPPQGAGAHSCCVLDGLVERPPLGRALKKSPFFMTKTENAYDL